MPVNTITSGTTTIAATADDQLWVMGEGESVTTNTLQGFSTAGFSNLTLSVAGSLYGTSGIGLNSTSTNVTILIAETGSVSGSTFGIINTMVGATIINEGTISSSYAIESTQNSSDSVILNSGTISATSLAVKIVGDNHSLTNSGVIESTGAHAVLFTHAGSSIIHNTGSISGDAYAVRFFQSTSVNSLFNSGTISTLTGPVAVLGDDERQVIVNSGTINGEVQLLGGNDLFDSRGGTVTGSVSGGDGNDTILTGVGGQILTGGAGADILSARGGKDKLFGNGGQDILIGGKGQDILKGGAGKDVLNGGAGNDLLFGGSGSDVFKFIINSGNDKVKDYVDGTDLIDLSALNLADFAALAPAISSDGADALIDLGAIGGTGVITIDNAAGLLDTTDFIF